VNSLTQFIVEHNVGDWASIAGVIIVVVGFAITIINVLLSRSAARQARDAAVDARESMNRLDTVTEFSSAMSVMEEIKRLHRHGAWPILPDRYSALRKSLISIRTNNPDLTNEQQQTIQNAIQHFVNIEKIVEKCMTDQTKPDVSRLNQRVSSQIDLLQAVLIEIKNKVGA